MLCCDEPMMQFEPMQFLGFVCLVKPSHGRAFLDDKISKEIQMYTEKYSKHGCIHSTVPVVNLY